MVTVIFPLKFLFSNYLRPNVHGPIARHSPGTRTLIMISRHTVCRKMRNAPLTRIKIQNLDRLKKSNTPRTHPFGISASHSYHSQLNRKPKPSNSAQHRNPQKNWQFTGRISTRGLNPTFQREQSLMLLQRITVGHPGNVIAHNPSGNRRVCPITLIGPFGRQRLWLN